MGVQNVPNRSVIASGRFNGNADGSSNVRPHSKSTSMPSVNGDASPSGRIRESRDNPLSVSLKDTVDPYAKRDGSSRNDWQGLPSLTELVAHSNRSLNTSASETPSLPTTDSGSTDSLTQHSVGVLLGELLSGPATESQTASDSVGADWDSDQKFNHGKLLFPASDTRGTSTVDSTSLRSIQASSALPFCSGDSSSTPLLKSRDSFDTSSLSASLSDYGFVPSRGIGLPDWTTALGEEIPHPPSQSSSALSGSPDLLTSPMNSDHSPHGVAGSLLRGGLDDVADNPFLRLDPSFNSMFASRLSPSSLFDTHSVNDQGGPVGSSWNQGFGGNSSSPSDFNASSDRRESQSGDGRGDLSKTNELLQQLIEEVRKGRQGFLPINDRNSTY